MAATATESLVYGDLFGTSAMRAMWDDAAMAGRWAEVEAALAHAQAEAGVIPAGAAAAIAGAARGFVPDLPALGARTVLVGYPIVELVRQLAAAVPEAARGYLHWGATTQDIMDTAVVLALREALGLLGAELDAVRDELARLAHAHRDTPMPGRTHLQHALPVTFGQKAAVWLDALDRAAERLEQLRPRALRAQLGGAAGTLASQGAAALAVRQGFARALDLAEPRITWHAARDGLAECVSWMALLGASLAKAATDIMLMAMDEIAEAREPFVPGRGASSTMPQKANPIACEVILACARALREKSSLMLDAVVADFERATGPWHLEWLALPEACLLASGLLAQAKFLFAGLVVHPDAMARNLGLTRGLIMAEAAMMRLAPHTGRGEAHHIVYAACRRVRETGAILATALAEDPRVTAHLSAAEIAAALEPGGYLGAAGAMVDAVLAGRR